MQGEYCLMQPCLTQIYVVSSRGKKEIQLMESNFTPIKVH